MHSGFYKTNAVMTVDACVAQHQGDRKEQQDRVALMPHPDEGGGVLAVVADGMGGHTGAALAAQQVLHTAAANLARFSMRDESAKKLLESSFNEAHLLIKGLRYINEKDPYSTAVMLLLQPGKASWAHCGDSRMYYFRGERLLFHTTDHSYVEELVAKGQISPEQALRHSHRNVLLSTLGSSTPPQIDYGETDDLRSGDAFVLCSDGLWGHFSDAELAAAVAGHSAREASDLLIGQARTRSLGGGDNISLVVIKLLAPPPRKLRKPKIPGFTRLDPSAQTDE